MGNAVRLHDELGSRVANLESLGCLVDGEVFPHNEINQLQPLLNGPNSTFSEINVWSFFNSF